jgi:hypothetical protein
MTIEENKSQNIRETLGSPFQENKFEEYGKRNNFR